MSLGEEKRLSGTAVMVMFATMLSRVTGFLRNVLIKNIMLPQGYSDEFIVAFSLPDLVFELLVGGAIAAAIIPILASSLSKRNEEDGWKAIGTLLNITIIAVIILEMLFFIWTPDFVKLLAIGYEDGTKEFALTVKLTRILLPSAIFMILAGQCNGILNAYNKFAAVAFGPVVYNLCVVSSIIVFGGKNAELTSWGVMFSALIYFLMQLAFTLKHFKLYRPRLFLKNETFIRLVRLAVPSLLASAVWKVNTIITGSFSTVFAQNSVTVMNNANRTWQLPLGIFAQSMGVTILPALSSRYAEDRKDDYKRILYKGIRTILILCIPSTVVLMVLNRQIMQILFIWNDTVQSEVLLNGLALFAFAPALLFQSVVVILNRAFYSIQNTRIPLISGIVAITANLAANDYFIRHSELGVAGTAMAFVIAVMVNAFILIFMFSQKTGLMLIPENFDFLAKVSLAAVAAGVVLWAFTLVIPFPWEESYTIGKKIMEVLVVGLQFVFAFLTFVIIAVLLKIEEVRHLIGSVLARIKGLFNRRKYI